MNFKWNQLEYITIIVHISWPINQLNLLKSIEKLSWIEIKTQEAASSILCSYTYMHKLGAIHKVRPQNFTNSRLLSSLPRAHILALYRQNSIVASTFTIPPPLVWTSFVDVPLKYQFRELKKTSTRGMIDLKVISYYQLSICILCFYIISIINLLLDMSWYLQSNNYLVFILYLTIYNVANKVIITS